LVHEWTRIDTNKKTQTAEKLLSSGADAAPDYSPLAKLTLFWLSTLCSSYPAALQLFVFIRVNSWTIPVSS
jgi:hypothetical protein